MISKEICERVPENITAIANDPQPPVSPLSTSFVSPSVLVEGFSIADK